MPDEIVYIPGVSRDTGYQLNPDTKLLTAVRIITPELQAALESLLWINAVHDLPQLVRLNKETSAISGAEGAQLEQAIDTIRKALDSGKVSKHGRG